MNVTMIAMNEGNQNYKTTPEPLIADIMGISAKLPEKFILKWEECYDDDDNTYWEAMGPYCSEDGDIDCFRIRQKLHRNRIQYFDDSDEIFKIDCYETYYHHLDKVKEELQGYCDEIWKKILKEQGKLSNVEKEEEKECNLIRHAKKEFEVLGWPGDDNMQKDICDHILKMVKVFSDEGHSGFSANYTINLLRKLLAFEPISPLTGEDSEWCEYVDGKFQNVRCSRIFKDEEGVYDIDGKVFIYPDGCSYTNRNSRVPVTFPYTPKTEYVHVDNDGNVTNKNYVVSWPDREGYWWVRDENWMDLARSYIYNDPEQEEDTYAIKLSIGDNLTENDFADSSEFIWLGESFDAVKNSHLDKQEP